MKSITNRVIAPFMLFLFLLTSANVTGQVTFNGVSLSNFTTVSQKVSCIVDMNNDYLPDIVRVNSSQIRINFQNAGGGFTEQTFNASPTQQGSPSWSIAAGDINGDGYNDLLLGSGSRVTFVYNNSATSFSSDNSESTYIFSQRSTMADIDNDGYLDAFVCHDIDQSHPYRNDGSGTLNLDFSLLPTADMPGNYAAIWVDYDNDRDCDLYITKCRGGSSHGDPERTNLMYRNNGNGTYTEVGASIGLDDNAQSWATVFDDLDNDGDMDAFVVNHSGGPIAANRYYKNQLMETGTATFTDIIGSTGISSNDLGSWDNVAADFDNDGDLDILSELSKELYINNGNNTFTGQDLSFDEGAIGDVDNDGDLDVVYGNTWYRNDTAGSNNWIKVNTVGTNSNLNGIGARIEITGSFGKKMREVRSGQGFQHMSSLSTHFGLGSDTSITALTIFWPSGTVDVINNPTINQTINVTEGETLSLEQSLTDKLILFPNPTTGLLHLNEFSASSTAIYTVFDITGKRVLNGSLSSNIIDVSPLAGGNYILRIMAEGQLKSQKFIKH